jgi:hypothetical protein
MVEEYLSAVTVISSSPASEVAGEVVVAVAVASVAEALVVQNAAASRTPPNREFHRAPAGDCSLIDPIIVAPLSLLSNRCSKKRTTGAIPDEHSTRLLKPGNRLLLLVHDDRRAVASMAGCTIAALEACSAAPIWRNSSPQHVSQQQASRQQPQGR